MTAWRTSGRSKKRAAPRTTYGTPRLVSASSKASDWALIRNRMAISPGALPSLRSAAMRVATAAASATSSECGV